MGMMRRGGAGGGRTWCVVLVLIWLGLLCGGKAGAVQALSDTELAAVTGQALMFSSKTVDASQGLTFYQMGLDAAMALNANFQHLQLGCGGANGSGACDIDISNFSLSGIPGVGTCPSSGSTVSCDAVLVRPSVTFAIANDGSPTRQVVGFQLGAQSISGQLTFGVNDGTANGIKTFSGYMTTLPTTGTADTSASVFGGGARCSAGQCQTAADNEVVSGDIRVQPFPAGICIFNCHPNFTTDPSKSAGIIVPAHNAGTDGPITFALPSLTASGNRLVSVSGTGTTVFPSIPLDGTAGTGSLYFALSQAVDGLVSNVQHGYLAGTVDGNDQPTSTGYITGINVNLPISEQLGYIHVVKATSPFYLSFQNSAVHWPTAATADTAARGWWMGFGNSVDIGTLSVPSSSPVDPTPVFPQIASALTTYFSNPANTVQINGAAAWSALVNGSLVAPVGTVALTGASLSLPLSNLPLSGASQTPPGNCYGSYKFC
jgi:hypothetical protein